MPGAFAHITAVNIATDNNALCGMNIPMKAKLILSKNQNYLELGCVSPDYPYLAVGHSEQNKWADLMHYEKTGDVIKAAVHYCKKLEGLAQEKCFAWLCGYMSHVAADITIHPVVELKVGPYEQNKTQHRTCEMNQDAYIWPRLNLGEIGLADRVELNIGSCTSQNGCLDDDITGVWQAILTDTHSDYARLAAPDFNAWHTGFQLVVNHAEEGYRLFPWARHVAANNGLLYPRKNEIDDSFITNLETPNGRMHYNDIFDLAIKNIQFFIAIIANAVFDDGECSQICNWNLDNGRDETGSLTAWNI
ncbi:zinc dependent phospholipase C family protein [Pseudoalteromonas tunicata]|uniref:zinc dependent phospholipase C family protein n=1 Tax=Pseudoalteromonas tunicata TaxID=314281 RepID=UPI00273D0C09|nr:zinc dependent phospholipase C family protein [Pseudoalteromonas tunicata]MDP5214496.1 zinc dependent phospholipase C family protein [Pseudoalteromonas tunicata]